MMLWSYAMVILTDPGRVVVEGITPQPQLQTGQQQNGQVESQGGVQQLQQPHQSHPMIQYPAEPHLQEAQEANLKRVSSEPVGVMIPGAQGRNRSGYIHITEDPSAQSHPLWCSKCEHAAMVPLYLRYPDETWTHQVQIIGMVFAGIFGLTLLAFTISHIRLILLNRTTIEDHLTPLDEGPFPCLRKGWSQSEGEINQGNERLYDLGFKENWQQAMGKGWTCVIPVRFPRPEGPIYNQKVVARQWRDYNQQLEAQKQQQQQHQQQQQQQVPQQLDENAVIETARPIHSEHDVQYRPSSPAQVQAPPQV
ncbi:hypothetical protein BGX27_011559 [Mortierella sp. AM989]|nr:hypothetical protein BGX27_011559 [Mortierella sp. AM989]